MLNVAKDRARIQIQTKQQYLIDYFRTFNCKDGWLKIYSSYIKELDNSKYEDSLKDLLQEKKFFLSPKAGDIIKARESVIA
jgi:hypothetical protein